MKKFKLFFERMQDASQRKLFYAIFGGKMLGVGLCFLIMFGYFFFFGTPAKVRAQDATPAPAASAAAAQPLRGLRSGVLAGRTECAPAAAALRLPLMPLRLAAAATPPPNPPYVNPINTMWVLVTAFLVFFMQAGFMFLECGFARSREAVNVLLEGLVDTCLCGILFWAWGFAWMFGAGDGMHGLIGNQYYFLNIFRIPMDRRASPRWRSSSSSSRSRIPARPLPPAPWWAAPGSGAICSTASA